METFVVRVLIPVGESEGEGRRLRGTVQQVSGGTDLPFATGDELLDVLRTSTFERGERT